MVETNQAERLLDLDAELLSLADAPDDLLMRNPYVFGVKSITSLDDWKLITKNHENESRSAYLVGQQWLGASGKFPSAVHKVISTLSPIQLRPSFSVAEHITVLDTLISPSRTDLMVYCQEGKSGTAVIAVEGKVTESFDEPIRFWIRDKRQSRQLQSLEDLKPFAINPGKQQRLNWLCERLELSLDKQSEIRYQLLHRTVAALLEARHIGANTAIMLVQSFAECSENWNDYLKFSTEMGFNPTQPNSITESKVLPRFPGIAVRLGWVDDSLQQQG